MRRTSKLFCLLAVKFDPNPRDEPVNRGTELVRHPPESHAHDHVPCRLGNPVDLFELVVVQSVLIQLNRGTEKPRAPEAVEQFETGMEVLSDLLGRVDQESGVELLYLIARYVRLAHLLIVDRVPHVVLARRQHTHQVEVERAALCAPLGSSVDPRLHQQREKRTGSSAEAEGGQDRKHRVSMAPSTDNVSRARRCAAERSGLRRRQTAPSETCR